MAIITAITFIGTSLTLAYYFWRVSDNKSQTAKIKQKIYRLDRDLFKQ